MNARKPLHIKKLNLRFTIWYALLVFVAFGLIILSISLSYSKNILQEKSNVALQKVDLVANALDNEVSAVYALYNMMLDNAIIASHFSTFNQNQSLNEAQLAALSKRFAYYQIRGVPTRGIFAVAPNGEILDPLYRNSDYRYLTDERSAFASFLEQKRHTYFSSPNAFPLYSTQPSHSAAGDNITFFGEYYVKPDYRPLGYVAINVVAKRFFARTKSLCAPTFDYAFIRTPERAHIPLSQNELAPAALPDSLYGTSARLRETLDVAGEQYMVYTQPLSQYPSWVFVGLISLQSMRDSTRKMTSFILGVFALAVLVVAIISFYIAKKITNPLMSVNSAMRCMESGRYPQPVACNTHDEINTLVVGFNSMVQSVQKLAQELVLGEQEKKKIEVAMVQSQLDLLQSQINPHFIHNTLNTMKYMAAKAGNVELCDTIVAFNALLRASISSGNPIVSLAEEIGYINSYMHIQQKRYEGNNIRFVCNAEPIVLCARIPKLILQPLVENALFHGLLPCGHDGSITVTCLLDCDDLAVRVSDDGVGMDEQTVQALLHAELKNPRGYNSIGLLNVKERLELYYGAHCAFRICGKKGQGTTIYFRIPFQRS